MQEFVIVGYNAEKKDGITMARITGDNAGDIIEHCKEFVSFYESLGGNTWNIYLENSAKFSERINDIITGEKLITL